MPHAAGVAQPVEQARRLSGGCGHDTARRAGRVVRTVHHHVRRKPGRQRSRRPAIRTRSVNVSEEKTPSSLVLRPRDLSNGEVDSHRAKG